MDKFGELWLNLPNFRHIHLEFAILIPITFVRFLSGIPLSHLKTKLHNFLFSGLIQYSAIQILVPHCTLDTHVNDSR